MTASTFALGWCVVCGSCASMPEWPQGGEPHVEWVSEALEWRLGRGLYDCPETMPALDALTLEWISKTDALIIHVDEAQWPFLNASPDLLRPLIQTIAWMEMTGQDVSTTNVNRVLKRIVRRTSELKMRSVRSGFELAERLGHQK